jgi:hypothetical protein
MFVLPGYPGLWNPELQIVVLLGSLMGFLVSFASIWCMSRTSPTIYSLTGSLNKVIGEGSRRGGVKGTSPTIYNLTGSLNKVIGDLRVSCQMYLLTLHLCCCCLASAPPNTTPLSLHLYRYACTLSTMHLCLFALHDPPAQCFSLPQKVIVALFGVWYFEEPTNAANVASIALGLAAGLLFVFAKSIQPSQSSSSSSSYSRTPERHLERHLEA